MSTTTVVQGRSPVDPMVPESLRAMLDGFTDPALVTTVNGRRLFANQAMYNLVGAEAVGLGGGVPTPVWIPVDEVHVFTRLLRTLPAVVAGVVTGSASLQVVERDGSLRRMRLSLSSYADGVRPPLAIWLFLADQRGPAGADLGRLPAEVRRRLSLLTRREREVLDLLLDGWRVATIARSLFVSQQTVRNHLKAIYRKLQAHSQRELIELLRNS